MMWQRRYNQFIDFWTSLVSPGKKNGSKWDFLRRVHISRKAECLCQDLKEIFSRFERNMSGCRRKYFEASDRFTGAIKAGFRESEYR